MFFRKIHLKPGDLAPTFSATNQDGQKISLMSFKGRPVLIYFYPKDDTPGCSQEACTFRNQYADFKNAGAVVLGVSRQGQGSHKKFKDKYGLPFDLLADENGLISKAFGIACLPLIGWTMRKSVLIDANGRIAKVYDRVNAKTHSDHVLKDIYALINSKDP